MPGPPGTVGPSLPNLPGAGVGDWLAGIGLLYGPSTMPAGKVTPGLLCTFGGVLPNLPGAGVGTLLIGMIMP